MARRSGLGRGSRGAHPDRHQWRRRAPSLREVPVGQIQPNPHQPRRQLRRGGPGRRSPPRSASSGVLQPVLVRQVDDDRYELIAGERRWRAARRPGCSRSRRSSARPTTSALEQALVENLHREDLNPLEEAAAYQQLLEDFALTQDEVARRVGKSRGRRSPNTLRLFQLPPSHPEARGEGQVSAGHAKALLGTPDRAFQEALARRIVADGLSVRDAEEAVRQQQRAGGGAAERAAPAPVAVDPLRRPGLLELEEPARGAPRHPGPGRDGRATAARSCGVRRPRGPRAHLPGDDRG